MSMAEGEDYLFRPVLRGLVRLESLFGTDITLEHIALANEALDVQEENQRRYERHQAALATRK